MFAVSPAVRYVAYALGRDVQTRERPGLADASSTEPDRYGPVEGGHVSVAERSQSPIKLVEPIGAAIRR